MAENRVFDSTILSEVRKSIPTNSKAVFLRIIISAISVSGDLINARREKGLTQKKFAEQIGITNSRLCSIERGRVKPSAKMLETICDELGLIIRLTNGKDVQVALGA